MSDAFASTIAGALFPRIRSVILALDRQDRLETAQDFVGWLDALREDSAQVEELAEQAVLRALRVAADPTNFRILQRLAANSNVPLRALMEDLNLGRVPVHERVNELMQAGLAVQELESDDVRATPLTEAMVALVQSISQELAGIVGEWIRDSRGEHDRT